ncbi:MAG TPA: hypothetical protein VGC32_04525 [Solirubrobacterales bacterium]
MRRLAMVLFCLAGLGTMAAAPAAADWTTTQLPGPPGELFLLNVSCPTTNFCSASGTQNLIATSTDPTGGAAAWNTIYAGEGRQESTEIPVISNRQVQGISCPSARLCVAVTNLGQIYSSIDPTGPASAWNVAELKPTGRNIHLYGVSCPTESFCVAVSGRRVNTGKVFTTTDPTGGADAWHEADLGESFDLRAVSCASPTLCVAVAAAGEIVASRNPAGGAGAWSAVGSPGGRGVMQSIDCVVGVCLTGNGGGDLFAAAEPLDLGSWGEASGGGSVQVTGSACASATACLAVDDNGDVIVSTDPTGSRPGWTSTNVRPYTPAAETQGSENANGLFGAACPGLELCILVGSRGAILTNTEPFAVAPVSATSGGASKGKGGAQAKRGPRRPRAKIAHVWFYDAGGNHQVAVPRHVELRLRFYARGPVRRYECRIDRRRFRPCRSPNRMTVGGRGIHSVQVRAVGTTGLRGPAARTRFYIGRICHRRPNGRLGACREGAGEMPSGPGWVVR